MKLEACRVGQINIMVDDGDIRLSRCEGKISLTADDGSVIFREIRSTKIDIELDDGDMELDLVACGGSDVYVLTDDGDVEIRMDADLSESCSLLTDTGHIRLDLPHSERGTHSGRRLAGELKVRVGGM